MAPLKQKPSPKRALTMPQHLRDYTPEEIAQTCWLEAVSARKRWEELKAKAGRLTDRRAKGMRWLRENLYDERYATAANRLGEIDWELRSSYAECHLAIGRGWYWCLLAELAAKGLSPEWRFDLDPAPAGETANEMWSQLWPGMKTPDDAHLPEDMSERLKMVPAWTLTHLKERLE